MRQSRFLTPGPMTEEEIYTEARRLLEEIHTAEFLMPLERPDFGPTQVRSVDEMVPGRTYNLHHEKHKLCDAYVFHGVVEDRFGRALDMTSVRWGTRTSYHYLSDRGLAPYSYNNWNPNNWIEDPSKKGVA